MKTNQVNIVERTKTWFEQRHSRLGKGKGPKSLSKYFIAAPLLILGITGQAMASTAYGSLNNFDCVNDTGVETHGFEIELDYGRTTDITYTYDYNHYGTPKIYEDLTDPTHPKVFVRYQSAKNPDGTWKAYTAIPSGPILPTQGHQFTNPAINFGGEHFGVGFRGNPVAVKYNWLLDDGSGNLVHGPAVYISTPSFTYYPPAPAAPARVVAAVVPPPPPVLPPLQFGKAQWVKEIKTTSHNPAKIELQKLVGDDPGKPQPWANGEAPEIEMEWRILQTEFAAADGGKNHELKGAPEDLPGGNELITRRYEFYKYTGPCDAETGEAMADQVAADGKHGVGFATYADHFDNSTGEWVVVTKDLSKIIVVGEFFGAQMAGFDVAPALGLIDHIQDIDVNTVLPKRQVVIIGGFPFTSSIKSGALPAGLTYDHVTGVLSGTPTASGVFNFTIEATDIGGTTVSKAYALNVIGDAPASFLVTVASSNLSWGKAVGGGTFLDGSSVTVTATAKLGFAFVNWTNAGVEVSTNTSYNFTVNADTSLVANFARICTITTAPEFADRGTTAGDGTYNSGTSATVTATPNVGYDFDRWMIGTSTVSRTASYTFVVQKNRNLIARFVPYYMINTSSSPEAGGTTTGGGKYDEGHRVVVKAVPNLGYKFIGWTEGGVTVSIAKGYYSYATADRNLVAVFVKQ